MQAYQKGKVYDKNGMLEKSGVHVVIDDDRVHIGQSTYPIDEVTIDADARTITSDSGWRVEY